MFSLRDPRVVLSVADDPRVVLSVADDNDAKGIKLPFPQSRKCVREAQDNDGGRKTMIVNS